MDPDFTFPARSRPIPRPAPQSSVEPANRESNALRASVLDAALELGFTSKSMTNWMFSNALDEEEEEPGEHSPARVQLSPTSDEYAPYSTPPTSTESHSESLQPSLSLSPFPLNFPSSGAGSNTVSARAPQVHFPPVPPTTNKLRKRRDPAAGYESDGGYVSDGGKKAKTRTRTKSKPKDPDPALVFPIGEPTEFIPLSKEERKRQKKEKAAKAKDKDFGNETDAEDGGKSKSPSKPKKNKKNSADAGGYETDDGYSKQKARSRFFSLRKKSDSAAAAEAPPPPPIPVPEREVFVLPIASRFATTLGSASDSGAPSRAQTPLLPPSRPYAFAPGSGTSSPASSRAETPLLPPSRPFASGSSSPSFSSSSASGANSLLTPGDQDGFGSPLINTASFADEDNWRNGDVLGHTADKSSNSTLTVTPASLSPSSSQPRSPQPPNGNAKLSAKSNANANAKPKFLISYPLTRTASPGNPPAADQNTTRPVKPRNITVRIPDPISLALPSRSDFNSRTASPVGSPFVLLTPVNPNTGGPSASGRISPAPSPYGHGYTFPEIVPSTEYLVPSPSPSRAPTPSPPPNVLAYYDVPPPSPPPNVPLPPRPPPSAMRDAPIGVTPVGVARLRSISRDRTGGGRDALSPTADLRLVGRSPSPSFASPWPAGAGGAMSTAPTPMHDGGAVQRGRAAPFPSQPIYQTRAAAAGTGVGPGLAARAKVQRYRDLYAIQIPGTPREHAGARWDDNAYGQAGVDVPVDVGSDAGDEEAEADPEMVGVLGRFRDTLERERAGSALERNNSGALRPGRGAGVGETGMGTGPDLGAYSDDDEASRYPDEDRTAGRSTMYRFDNDSRGSFLDVEKSEQVRGRLVDRVGVMYDLSGRERPPIPPMPKLPPELLAGGRGNRF